MSIKKLLFVGSVLMSLTASLSAQAEWIGNALYTKDSVIFGLGGKKAQFKMKIIESGNRILLKLPGYGCLTELIFHAKDENKFIYSEKLLEGDCIIDADATTTLKFNGDTIEYIWKTSSESLTSTLKKTKN